MVAGFDRDRAFYATVLVVVGHYYILFAAMGASTPVLATECLFACGFFALSAVGFRNSPWLIAAGLVGHGVFDAFHPFLVRNPGVPAWWPGFCGAFDVAAGALLAVLLVKRPRTAPQS